MKRGFRSAAVIGMIVVLSMFIYGCGGGGGGSAVTPAANTAPAITALSVSKAAVLSTGELSTLSVTASDANSDTLSYAWSGGAGGTLTKVSNTQYTFSTTATGSYTVTITASDGRGGTAATSTTIVCFGANANQGGVRGEVKVPLSSYKQVDAPTSSDNILSAPVKIAPAGQSSFRDLSRSLPNGNRAAAVTACKKENFIPGEIILKLESGGPAAGFATERGLIVKKQSVGGRALIGLDVSGLGEAAALDLTRKTCENLNGEPGVAYANLNGIVKGSAIPNDTQYASQWHYPLMNLERAWDVATGSANVVVAVLDTGIVAGHTDIAGRLVAGYDFISDAEISCDGGGIDANPEDVADSRCATGAIDMQNPKHSGYHGTHVGGTIGAETNNGAGVAGVDWRAKIMPIRVLGAGGGTDYDIEQGMLYAAGLANDSGTLPANAAKVINMSLAGEPGGSCSTSSNDIFTQVHNAGVTIFVAAGNNSAASLNPTSLCSYAIAVGAVDRYMNRSYYSNTGTGLDIMAPGGDTSNVESDGVLSCLRDDVNGADTSYSYYQGTSMATPHAAGVASLMIAANPAITPDQIATIIAQTSKDLGSAGTDTMYGTGLIDAYKAVIEAQRLVATPSEPAVPIISVSTEKLYFPDDVSTQTVLIRNTGTAVMTISSVTDTETSGGNWLTTSVATSGDTFILTATVNRTSLANATYTATINIASTGGNAAIAVTMSVNTPTFQETPAGCLDPTVYILSVNSDTYDTISQAEISNTANVAGGDYNMYGVTAGDIFLVAGTDCNNDSFICDQNIDLCGVYPTDAEPAPVTVAGQAFTSSVNFSVTKLVAARPTGEGGTIRKQRYERIR